MMISYAPLGICVECDEQIPLVIYSENAHSFVELITDIKAKIETGDGNFAVVDSEGEVNLPKRADIVIDPWNLDFDSKKIKGKLFQLLEDYAIDNYYEKFAELKSSVFEYMEMVSSSVPFSVTYDTKLDNKALFKIVDIRVSADSEKLIDSLVGYLKIMTSFLQTDIFFLVNIKMYLTHDELVLFYKEMKYNRIRVVLLEAYQSEKCSDEKIVIIDKDNCIIYA